MALLNVELKHAPGKDGSYYLVVTFEEPLPKSVKTAVFQSMSGQGWEEDNHGSVLMTWFNSSGGGEHDKEMNVRHMLHMIGYEWSDVAIPRHPASEGWPEETVEEHRERLTNYFGSWASKYGYKPGEPPDQAECEEVGSFGQRVHKASPRMPERLPRAHRKGK